jgi:hypothetical protein
MEPVLTCLALRKLANHVEEVEDMEKRLHERDTRCVKRARKAEKGVPS